MEQGTSTVVSTGTGNPSSEEYEQYKLRTRGEYEKLMVEFEFRCQRAAMMNYYLASNYNKKVYLMEVVAASLGTVSLATIAAWSLTEKSDYRNSLGRVGVLAAAAASIIEVMSKGSTQIIPSFSQREERHRTVGASWQALALKTGLSKIQLDNPKSDVPKYNEWYRELITQREEICSKASIPDSTYKKFNDPKYLLEQFQIRQQLLQDFLNLQKKDADKKDADKKDADDN